MNDASPAHDWRDQFERRGFHPEEVGPPPTASEHDPSAWFQVCSHFATRSFLRVLVGEQDHTLSLYLQLALADGETAGDYLHALTETLRERSTALTVVSDQTPWVFLLAMDRAAKLDQLLGLIEQLMEHVDATERGASLRELSPRDLSTLRRDSPEPAQPPQAERSPLESIGAADPAAAPSAQDTARARLETFEVTTDQDTVVVRLAADAGATQRARDALIRRTQRQLEVRFDLVTRSAFDDKPAPFLRLEASPVGASYDLDASALAKLVDDYLSRLRRMASLDISLGQLDSRVSSSDPTQSASTSRAESHPSATGASSPQIDDAAEVVFAFGPRGPSPSSTHERAIKPGDYADPRLTGEDSTSALVDVILRHPGYSDRNMRQVLSILLDIDYFRAGQIIDRAPCAIAWRVSQARAANLRLAIENAGGRIKLVEPGSFARSD